MNLWRSITSEFQRLGFLGSADQKAFIRDLSRFKSLIVEGFTPKNGGQTLYTFYVISYNSKGEKVYMKTYLEGAKIQYTLKRVREHLDFLIDKNVIETI